MRQIPDDMLELICGGYGWSSETGTMPIVVIEGGPGGWGGGWGGGGGSWGGGDLTPSDPGGGSGGGPDVPDDSCTHSSPAPAITPTGVNLESLRDMIMNAANQIKATADYQDNEHGVVIVRASDGTLRSSAISTGVSDGNTINVDLHTGEKIVGWLHSHPETNIEQTKQSPFDVEQRKQLIAANYADAGMLTYILDVKSNGVFEYAANSNKNTEPKNNIATDTTCH